MKSKPIICPTCKQNLLEPPHDGLKGKVKEVNNPASPSGVWKGMSEDRVSSGVVGPTRRKLVGGETGKRTSVKRGLKAHGVSKVQGSSPWPTSTKYDE